MHTYIGTTVVSLTNYKYFDNIIAIDCYTVKNCFKFMNA